MIENNTENQSYNSYFLNNFNSSLVLTVLFSGIIWLFCVFWFLIWLFKSLWNANKELNKLPYISTRERQLSLRYFKHHTFLVIIYILIAQIYSVYYYGSPLYLVDTRRTNISTLIVVSTYVYLVAFMYLPMTNKNIQKNQHNFKLSNAIFLCHISWQSYMSQTQIQNQPSKWGLINLQYYNLQLIQYVTNKKHDTQIIVSIAEKNMHQKFKKQRNKCNNLNKNIKKQKKLLLLAPQTKHGKYIHSRHRSKFFDDVSYANCV